MSSKTVAITGANGLLGSALAKRFLNLGYQVKVLLRPQADRQLLAPILNKITCFEGDILDISSLEAFLEETDLVVHAAAIVSFSPRKKEILYKTNVEGTANVVNMCLHKNCKKLLHISSIAAISRPEKNNKTLSEDLKWEESRWNTQYGKSKFLGELEVWRAIAEGLDAVIVNPTVILGEGDLHKSSTRLFKYVLDGNRFYTKGSINFVDLNDVVEASVGLLEGIFSNERYILNGTTMPYKQFYEEIANALQRKAPNLEAKSWQIGLLWRWEALKSFLFRTEPLVTKETATIAQTNTSISNQKIKTALGFEFTNPQETIRRIATHFAKMPNI